MLVMPCGALRDAFYLRQGARDLQDKDSARPAPWTRSTRLRSYAQLQVTRSARRKDSIGSGLISGYAQVWQSVRRDGAGVSAQVEARTGQTS